MRLEQQPLSVPSEHQLDAIRRDFATMENYLRTPTLTIMEHHSHQEELISLANLVAPPIHTGVQLFAQVRDCLRLAPTGCPSVDRLLQGGLREGHHVEVFGEAGSGKTQVCLMAACQALRRDDRVLYIDTSNAATMERVHAVFSAHTSHHQNTTNLQHLQFSRVYDAFALLVVLDECVRACAAAEAQQKPKPVSLLVIDSLGFLLAPLVMGDTSGAGHALMVAIAQQLRAMAERFGIAVLTTNSQVKAGSTPRAALGDAWQHQPHKRLRIVRAPGDAGGMRTVEHTRCTTGPAGGSSIMALGPAGVTDVGHAA